MRVRPPSALLLFLIPWTASLALHAASQQAAPSTSSQNPALAVIIVVDQMRADYIDRFRSDWTGGLKRLIADGAWFRNASYPYLTTVTCAGHATIATGTFPRRHGVIQNVWWDRQTAQPLSCTTDPTVRNIGYGMSAPGGDSARSELLPTLADAVRTSRHGHVIALSLKAASATMLAGHGGDIVTWLSPNGSWATSTAYSQAPVTAVEAYVKTHDLGEDRGQTWSRMLPLPRYLYADDGPGEAPPSGWSASFPHVLDGASLAGDNRFLDQWMRSPFADSYLGRFAAGLVRATQLGQHETPDVLAVSFSTPDFVGHAFGPHSQEIQDLYARLDQTIGRLLDDLDRTVGAGRYVVALTADHGVTPIPEQLVAAGEPGGRLSTPVIAAAIEQQLAPTLGSGRHVARIVFNDVYFEPGVYEKLEATPKLLASIIKRVSKIDGIDEVFRAEEARDGLASADPLLRSAALSYAPGRSGDLILVPRRGWMFAASGTTHATANLDDRRVPIVLYGSAVKGGEYGEAATPADVAPTLARVLGATMTGTDGRVLREALR